MPMSSRSQPTACNLEIHGLVGKEAREKAMKRLALAAFAAASAWTAVGLNVGSGLSFGTVFSTSAFAQSAACAIPTAPSATPEETAWRLFVAANCPGNGSQVVWENWIEQSQLYPTAGAAAAAGPAPKRLHGSPLARALVARLRNARALLTPVSECNDMRGPPPNVIPHAKICEEARLNPEAAAFVTGNGYQLRAGQTAAAQKGTDIEFPKPAIEVKVDWIPATDFTTPFTCDKPPTDFRVEMIDGTCYAMAGIHVASKLLDNWLWATFEPQSMLTNPLRCITFGDCRDAWGASPAQSSGGPSGITKLTPALQDLMTQANLAPAFANYRLDGAQTVFTLNGKPTYLGNSVIEGENVGMKKNTASCITCHSVSSIKKDGTDGVVNLHDQVGPQYKIPPGWIARDFVWSLFLACPGSPTQRCQ
jgi:hypothetical protein